MKILLLLTLTVAFNSCFRFNGPILLKNSKPDYLKIETWPIISSGSGGWENGIWYYNKDSIIWTYQLGNNIKAKILKPNTWVRNDSVYALSQPNGYHYGDYPMFKGDTSFNGIYLMYPNSSFTIGELNTRKKIRPSKNNLQGTFDMKELIIYTGKDTLVARGNLEIWNMLLNLDKGRKSFNKKGQLNGKRSWVIALE